MAEFGWSLPVWVVTYSTLYQITTNQGVDDTYLNIYDSDDVLLAPIKLDPSQFTVGAGGDNADFVLYPEESVFSPIETGNAAYATIDTLDLLSDPLRVLKVPCVESTSPVEGALAMESLYLVEGSPVAIISLVIPAGPILD
ncbi:MAG: hypothetical protein EOM24_23180 [Chloroflexia bacterium]|nr:hypothetical protein [Chloroflexia bacterium]